jgi:hypothetical protein
VHKRYNVDDEHNGSRGFWFDLFSIDFFSNIEVLIFPKDTYRIEEMFVIPSTIA